MKQIFSILSVLLIWMILSGHQLQAAKGIQEIEFSTLSRGGHYEQVIIRKDTLLFQKEKRRSSEETQNFSRIIEEVEWKELIQKTEHLHLDEISTLKSPTMKRAYDGATHSEIIITNDENQQYIHRFDDENPHELLKPLLQSIVRLRDL